MLNAGLFLVQTVTQLYLLTVLFRFVLQQVRADFYNPLSQFIVKVTNPLVIPARRVIPSIGRIDTATLVVLLVLECLVTWLLLEMLGASVTLDAYMLYVALRLIHLTLWLYTISILLYVILSWVAQAAYSPIAMLIGQVVGPVLRPVRRILPPISGIDLSPLVVLVLLQALRIALTLPPYLR
ncbi:MAG TPA: YggT family protein [Gammaproteobacteria bacterium]|jgi:YggT family protein